MSLEEKNPLLSKINTLQREVKYKIEEFTSQDEKAVEEVYEELSQSNLSWSDFENEIVICDPENTLRLLILIDKSINQIIIELKSGSTKNWLFSTLSSCLFSSCSYKESPCFTGTEEKHRQKIEAKLQYLQGVFNNKIDKDYSCCIM